jgi:hypothetical protein
MAIADPGFTSGKKYWECLVLSTTNSIVTVQIGGSTDLAVWMNYPGSIYGWSLYSQGNIYHLNQVAAAGPTLVSGDIVGVAVDMSTGRIWFAKNNVWINSGDPAGGLNPVGTGLTGTFKPGVSLYKTNEWVLGCFSASTQLYAPPAGFSALDPGAPPWYKHMIDYTAGLTPSNDNLTIYQPSNPIVTPRNTTLKRSGKWYWEIHIDASSGSGIYTGWGKADLTGSVLGVNSPGWSVTGSGYTYPGFILYNSTGWSTSDVIQVALDLDNGKIWYGKNGTYPNSGVPATGVNPASSGGFAGVVGFPSMTDATAGTITWRFCQTDFSYAIPAGFSALEPVGTPDAPGPIDPTYEQYNALDNWTLCNRIFVTKEEKNIVPLLQYDRGYIGKPIVVNALGNTLINPSVLYGLPTEQVARINIYTPSSIVYGVEKSTDLQGLQAPTDKSLLNTTYSMTNVLAILMGSNRLITSTVVEKARGIMQAVWAEDYVSITTNKLPRKNNQGYLAGQVMTNSVPNVNLPVWLLYTANGFLIAQCMTDENGNFSFFGLEVGNPMYTLVVRRSGYEPAILDNLVPVSVI